MERIAEWGGRAEACTEPCSILQNEQPSLEKHRGILQCCYSEILVSLHVSCLYTTCGKNHGYRGYELGCEELQTAVLGKCGTLKLKQETETEEW